MADFVRNLDSILPRTSIPNGYYQNVQYNTSAAATGYKALSRSVTFNGTTVATPTFLFYGDRPNASPWVAEVGAVNLATSAFGVNPPAYQEVGTYGKGVDFTNPHKDFVGSGVSAAYGIGTDDMLLEIVSKSNAEVSSAVAWAWMASLPATIEMWVQNDTAASKKLTFHFRVGAASLTFTSAGAIHGTNIYHHQIFFVNRNEASVNGCLGYNNGTNVITGNASTAAADASGTNAIMSVGGFTSTHTLTWNGSIYYVALWHAPNWFAAGAQCKTDADAWAAARYATLIA